MKRLDVQFTVKTGSRDTLTLTLDCSDTGSPVSMACVCVYNTGTWKVWRPNGTIVFCGAIVYSCRAGGQITYALDALVAACGTATFATAVVNDTVTVNGLVYTGVAGVKADNTEFSIDTGNTATALDFAASVTADTRTGITVPSIDQTATSCLAIATITAGTTGTLGNTIGLTTSGCTVTFSAATLTGGAGDAAPPNVGIWEGEVEYLNACCTLIDQSDSFAFIIQESF